MKGPLEETYSKRLDLRMWRGLLGFVWPYKGALLGLGIAAIATACADLAFPLITRRVVDDVAEKGVDVEFAPYVLAYLGFTTLLAAAVFTFIYFGGRIKTAVGHDIRKAGFENLQRLSFSYFDHRPVGWLMSRMTSDCERLANIFAWGILDLIWGGASMFGVLVILFVLDAKLAAVTLAVVPVLAIISAVFQKRSLSSSRVVRKTNSRLTAAYNEGLMGVQTSKVFVREDENEEEFGEISSLMQAWSVRNALQSAVYLPFVMTLGSLATGVALAVGGIDTIAGRISTGTFLAFLTYSRYFFDPVQELAQRWAELQMAQASAERIIGLVETEPEIKDSADVVARMREHAPAREGVAVDGLPDTIGEIRFEDVSFTYPGGQTVLEDFDLTVRSGETIALVGPTGGGKTTIVNLACRFYEPTRGHIRIDGVDYKERSLAWLQSNLGIVLQSSHLFSGSIADNIRYGKLDATQEEIEEAARLAGADAFVDEMKDGYATEVGEGGILLSSGQKQLLSFARAILARPRLLVMDEATSSVDTETEKRIQVGLEHVLEGRTCFVIAHRLSTVRSADRILFIDGGRIVEQGTHAELMAKRARYWELCTHQVVAHSPAPIGQ